MRKYYIILISCTFLIFYCAPTKVKTPQREVVKEPPISEIPAPEKAPPPKPSPEKPTLEKAPPVKPLPPKTYAQALSEWKSYLDVAIWMEKEFTLDFDRYKKFSGTLPVPRSPQETFQLKSGIYIDSAIFLKEVLNRINPSYKAQVVVLIMRPYGYNHYVCSFKKDGKFFFMDYGTPFKEITGVHGPYQSLEAVKSFYKKYHPIKREIEAVVYLQ